MASRIADVTDQVLDSHRLYGGSDSTNQSYTSASRCLNYASGASIQRPEVVNISNVPVVMNYKDTVGLFGVENHFVKVNVNIQNPVRFAYEIDGYFSATFSNEGIDPDDPYTYPNNGYDEPGAAFIDYTADLTEYNTFLPAEIGGTIIPGLRSKFFKVELQNLKTGNIYVDNWLDVRLYNRHYEEHPYDVMYVRSSEPFYIGFHARNTKRLPYNVNCLIGELSETNNLPALLEIEDIDPRLLATKR